MPVLSFVTVKTAITKYPQEMDFPIFIETGTLQGATIFKMESHFKRLYTIELKKDLYDAVCKKYKRNKISFSHGDSSVILPALVKDIHEPTIFWLDGHYSCGRTAKGDIEVPLIEELTGIHDNFKGPGILIIDDYRLFGTNKDVDWSYITLEKVLNRLGDRVLNYYHLPSAFHPQDRLIINIKSIE